MDDASTLSRLLKADSPGKTPATRPGALPPHIITRAAHRVGTAALTWGGAYVAALSVNEYVAHTVGELPRHGWNLGHTVAILFVTVSVALFALSRSRSLNPRQLLDLGLLYEVIGGFAIVLGTSAGMVWDERAHILGLSWICVWIAGFPFIIPATPARAAMAACVTALMAPAGLAAWHMLSGTSMPEARVWSGITIPPLLCAGVATIGSRIVYGLGQDIERARAMGAYRLEKRLGEGGMGEVWLASHRLLARPAAVKLIRPEVLGEDEASRLIALRRFEQEAQTTASLQSPHTIKVFDFGRSEDESFYYVMELLDGLDLESLVRRFGPLPPERVVYLVLQACHSLGEAHAKGLIHRDVKPANIYTCRMGLDVDFVKVLDFGLVKAVRRSDDQETMRMTAEHTAIGTPAYIAPEQVLGDAPIDARTDIYALGCVAYWLLIGEPVFRADTPLQTMMQHATIAPIPPSQRTELEIPGALEDIILACLEKNPERRPAGADALAHALLSCSTKSWTRERARRWWEMYVPENLPPTSDETGILQRTV
jgi:serine/threonine-protein kinase